MIMYVLVGMSVASLEEHRGAAGGCVKSKVMLVMYVVMQMQGKGVEGDRLQCIRSGVGVE